LEDASAGWGKLAAGSRHHGEFAGKGVLSTSSVRLSAETERFWTERSNFRLASDNLFIAGGDGVSCSATMILMSGHHAPESLRRHSASAMKATRLIRKAGLRGRMQAPEEFLRQMNRLSIAMTQQARRAGRKKARKRVLRQMKKLTKVVRAHAQRHRDLLDQQWKQTELTRGQTDQILRRIDGVLELLPKALKQAHERMIGARPVANADKILSLYDTEVRVIVRGKAGAEVDFGNTVLLGESRQGVILDYELFRGVAPADHQLLFGSLLRVWEATGHHVGAVATDRGFAIADNSRTLKEGGTFDGLCPRKPAELRRRMKGARFARLQRRRAQTDGRNGILKHGFLGRPMRAKGADHRELALAWGVLTHNLWMLARLRKLNKKPAALSQAA
jgi:hypothetical protein